MQQEMQQLQQEMCTWREEQAAKAERAAAQAAEAEQAAKAEKAERAAAQAAAAERAAAQVAEAAAEAEQAAKAAKAAELAAKAAAEAEEAAKAAAAQAATAVSASAHAWAAAWSGAAWGGQEWWGDDGQQWWWTDGQQGAAGVAASSQMWVPVMSDLLRAWLEKHGLGSVHDVDGDGWTALHHAAFESYDEENAATIFKELMGFTWQATCGFIHSQCVSSCPDSRGSRSELIWVCSLIGFQPDRLSA